MFTKHILEYRDFKKIPILKCKFFYPFFGDTSLDKEWILARFSEKVLYETEKKIIKGIVASGEFTPITIVRLSLKCQETLVVKILFKL